MEVLGGDRPGEIFDILTLVFEISFSGCFRVHS